VQHLNGREGGSERMSGTTNAKVEIVRSVVVMFIASSAAGVMLPLFMFPHELNIVPFLAYFPIAGLASFLLYRKIKRSTYSQPRASNCS
jgi:hypothetical protein